MREDLKYILADLKAHDPDRYMAALYLPEGSRADISALWAFDVEVSQIADIAPDQAQAKVRLQGWRDVFGSTEHSVASPLMRCLMSAIYRHNLPVEEFQAYLTARDFDLLDDPMPDQKSFDRYLQDTGSFLFITAGLCSGIARSDDLEKASIHAGRAVGIAKLLTNAMRHRASGRVYVPPEILKHHNLTQEGWLLDIDERDQLVIKDLALMGRESLKNARQTLAKLPGDRLGCFLLLPLVEPILERIVRSAGKMHAKPHVFSPLNRRWTLFRATMRQIP